MELAVWGWGKTCKQNASKSFQALQNNLFFFWQPVCIIIRIKICQCAVYISQKIISIQKHNLILKSGNRCIPVTTLCIWYFQPGDSKTPYWILRIVTEQKEADFLEVKKDTRRVDEIRAMKEAWESAEPGRAVKVISEYLISISAVMFLHKSQKL